MKPVETEKARCRTDGCSRPAEPGERECAACALERDLFFRYARLDSEEIRTRPDDETAGR